MPSNIKQESLASATPATAEITGDTTTDKLRQAFVRLGTYQSAGDSESIASKLVDAIDIPNELRTILAPKLQGEVQEFNDALSEYTRAYAIGEKHACNAAYLHLCDEFADVVNCSVAARSAAVLSSCLDMLYTAYPSVPWATLAPIVAYSKRQITGYRPHATAAKDELSDIPTAYLKRDEWAKKEQSLEDRVFSVDADNDQTVIEQLTAQYLALKISRMNAAIQAAIAYMSASHKDRAQATDEWKLMNEGRRKDDTTGVRGNDDE